MKLFISTILSVVLALSLSACGSSSDDHSTGSSSPNNSSTTSTKNSTSDANTIPNAVIKATLDVESLKPNTTVDYASHSMTQSGQKVGFEMVPASGHENDFKSGTIKETTNNGVDNVTLFLYKVNDNNQLSLIEPTSAGNVTTYVTAIGKSNTNISSGKEAVSYLKNQLSTNSDIAYNDLDGHLKKDKIGSYYTVQLVSKSMLKNGGSGVVGLYKVYQNGSYMLNGSNGTTNYQNQIKPKSIKNINGFVQNKNQSFAVNLKPWGNVEFVSGKITSGNHIPTVFYLTNQNGDILYNFSDSPFPYNVDVKAVSFEDVNKDGLKDIIVIVTQNDNNSYPIAALWLQHADKTFTCDQTVDGKGDIKSVKDYFSKKY
ncbi:hypothetical protein PU629_09180 [Pullulanibacillus sp. KACC 23026]|uniref:hypothetical protein n=1 Tax=Pullulanibacillus sp. KACC 23026 TaxID=3028315 RepID=UPI0023B135D3|nr:hypothetical protein [Pullulanibacillus sp. KACC 23026]WEG14508.1 hypothetical protein PU629_09180 [Pullulanibacillus sp. KACC 23026]